MPWKKEGLKPSLWFQCTWPLHLNSGIGLPSRLRSPVSWAIHAGLTVFSFTRNQDNSSRLIRLSLNMEIIRNGFISLRPTGCLPGDSRSLENCSWRIGLSRLKFYGTYEKSGEVSSFPGIISGTSLDPWIAPPCPVIWHIVIRSRWCRKHKGDRLSTIFR